MSRTLTAAVAAAIMLAVPAQAQTLKDGSGGTGGAAGLAPPMPDMSRSMSAPAPELSPLPPAPEPMNAPPVEEEKKDENAPRAETPEKPKQ